MCGIVGYIGQGQDAQQVILDALRRLEYRGYDSAGVAIFERGSIAIRRAVGKLGNLEAAQTVDDQVLCTQLVPDVTDDAAHARAPSLA